MRLARLGTIHRISGGRLLRMLWFALNALTSAPQQINFSPQCLDQLLLPR